MRKIITLLLLITLVSCGFKPMFSTSESNFSINKIEYSGKMGKIIFNNLKQYLKKEGRDYNYDLLAKVSENKEITIKDKKGNPSGFRQTVTANLSVFENDELIFEKTFQKKFDYGNSLKKFELSKFENEIKKSMLNKISEEIILSLYSIR
tara:strand:- start:92 stop:541 length:450 start_codon:yes stop_codon:yes gene_type:complete